MNTPAEMVLDGPLYRYEVGGQMRGSNYSVRRVELAVQALGR